MAKKTEPKVELKAEPKKVAAKKEEKKVPETVISAPPLVVKKKQPVEPATPITMEEIEGTMRYLGPKLKNPKTHDEAMKELKEFIEKQRTNKVTPKW